MAEADLSLAEGPPPTGWRRPGGTVAPFRYPPFRAIWFAMLFSNFGTMIQSVCAAWLMTELTTSKMLVAMIQASTSVPVMLFGVVAGAIADNFDRRRIMMVAQAALLALSAVLAAATFDGWTGPAMLLGITLLMGIATALNGPAWQASIRLQVRHEDVPQAVALNAISFNLARSVGPSLGGVILLLWGASAGFALNALSFVAIIFVLARWRPHATPIDRRPVFHAIGEGLRFAFTSRPISRVLLRVLVFGTGAAGIQALMPLAARDIQGGTALTFGLLLGGFGVGSIASALAVGPLRRRFGSEPVVIGGTLAVAIGALGMAHAGSTVLATAGTFIAGCGWTLTMTSVNVAVQMRAPEWVLGRAMSIYQAAAFGGMALGAYVWGALADHAGLKVALTGAGVWLIASVALTWFAPMPRRDEGRVDPSAARP